MPFERAASAGYLTSWAARLFARAIDRRLREFGVSSGQLPVFFALGNGEALSQKALVKAASIEQPTMAATLSRMERDGLVERQPDPQDGRGFLFSLTPLAMQKAEMVKEAVLAVNSEALADIPEHERKPFLATLKTIIGSLEEINSQSELSRTKSNKD